MTDDNKQEVENKLEVPEPKVNENTDTEATIKEQTPEEINWKKFREERDRDRKAREEAERNAREKEEQVKAYREALEQVMDKPDTQNLTQKEQDQIIADLMDEDIPTGADVKSFINKVVPKIVSSVLESNEEKRRKESAQREAQEMPQRLQKEHNDFSKIVTQENLDYLEYHYPEVADALGSLPNSFDKWSKVYKTVKKLVPNKGENDVKRIEQNYNKPQSVTSTSAQGSSDYTPGRRLSEEEKRANYDRLRRLARGG